MAKRTGLYFYEDWAVQMRAIPSKDFKKFILAMTDFFFYDLAPPAFSGTTAIIAGFVFPQLERTKDAIASGRLGGKRSAEMAKSRTEADLFPAYPTEGRADGADTYSRNGACPALTGDPLSLKQQTKTNTITNIDLSSQPQQGDGAEEEKPSAADFEAFWQKYPKKLEVKEAEEVFFETLRTKEAYARVMEGLEAWCDSEEWEAQGGRYVPRAAAFLRDRRYLMKPKRRDCVHHMTYEEADAFFERALQRTREKSEKYKDNPSED